MVRASLNLSARVSESPIYYREQYIHCLFTKHILLCQHKLTKTRAELAGLNVCAVPFLSHAAPPPTRTGTTVHIMNSFLDVIRSLYHPMLKHFTKLLSNFGEYDSIIFVFTLNMCKYV